MVGSPALDVTYTLRLQDLDGGPDLECTYRRSSKVDPPLDATPPYDLETIEVICDDPSFMQTTGTAHSVLPQRLIALRTRSCGTGRSFTSSNLISNIKNGSRSTTHAEHQKQPQVFCLSRASPQGCLQTATQRPEAPAAYNLCEANTNGRANSGMQTS